VNDESSPELAFTGERFTPECVREIWYEHMHRYVLAADLVEGRTVLDAACGEGYGAHILARKARAVTGIDSSQEAIAHAGSRYAEENLAFEVADCRKLPFGDGQFDCIVSFETLEHLEQQEDMLREFRRVLSAEGFLLISSPDRAVYTDRLKNENPFHVRELYRHELENLLATEFPSVRLLGHKLAFHSMIWPIGTEPVPEVALHQENHGAISRLAGPAGDAVYFIAACAADDRFLPQLEGRLWLFDDRDESVYGHYRHEIRKNMNAGTLLADRDREIKRLQAALHQSPNTSPAEAAGGGWLRRLFGKARK